MRRLVFSVLVLVVIFSIGYVVGDKTHTTNKSAETTKSFVFSPYMHETFTPLPCSSNTTLGIEGCAEKKVLSLDGSIDSLRMRIFHHLHSPLKLGDFENAELTWLHYRQTTCKSAADINIGGTLAAVDFADCLVTLDRQHVNNLTALLMNYSSD